MKKFLTLLLTVALTATLAITGTVAYLTDTDQDVNTMTMGSVQIDQIEQERGASGLTDFTQDKPLLPAVYTGSSIEWAASADWAVANDEAWKTVALGADKNVVDKFVTVKNEGKSKAYGRTIIAFEGEAINGTDIHIVHNAKESLNPAVSGEFEGTEYITDVVIGGVRYDVIVYTYANELDPTETTIPSLKQVYMDRTCDNEDVAKYGEKYDILVLSQAVQADGFDSATTALNESFGIVDKANAAKWFAEATGAPAPTIVADNAALQEALDAGAENIILSDNITGNLTFTQAKDKSSTIDANGKVFDGVLTVDGKSGQIMSSGLTIKNLVFRANSITGDACIDLGKSGDNNTRYTCNVTIENCTFDVPGAVGIKSYTGGDKNLTIKNCTATERAHSLAQLKGIDGVLVENCTVKSIRGINFNNSLNVTVKDCTIDVDKYGLRFGESDNSVVEEYEVINSTITSDNVDGDAAIVLRAGATNAKLTLDNVTINATTQMSGHESANIIVK